MVKASFPGLLINRTDPRMGILDIINWVLAGLLDRQVEVEIGSRRLKWNRAASTGTSSNSVVRVMALPERLLSLTTSPSRTSRTIWINTVSNFPASTPSAKSADFNRGT